MSDHKISEVQVDRRNLLLGLFQNDRMKSITDLFKAQSVDDKLNNMGAENLIRAKKGKQAHPAENPHTGSGSVMDKHTSRRAFVIGGVVIALVGGVGAYEAMSGHAVLPKGGGGATSTSSSVVSDSSSSSVSSVSDSSSSSTALSSSTDSSSMNSSSSSSSSSTSSSGSSTLQTGIAVPVGMKYDLSQVGTVVNGVNVTPQVYEADMMNSSLIQGYMSSGLKGTIYIPDYTNPLSNQVFIPQSSSEGNSSTSGLATALASSNSSLPSNFVSLNNQYISGFSAGTAASSLFPIFNSSGTTIDGGLPNYWLVDSNVLYTPQLSNSNMQGIKSSYDLIFQKIPYMDYGSWQVNGIVIGDLTITLQNISANSFVAQIAEAYLPSLHQLQFFYQGYLASGQVSQFSPGLVSAALNSYNGAPGQVEQAIQETSDTSVQSALKAWISFAQQNAGNWTFSSNGKSTTFSISNESISVVGSS